MLSRSWWCCRESLRAAPRLRQSAWPARVAAPTGVASASRAASSSSSAASRPMETWEEVELHRPKAPTLDGYVRPVGAPSQADIPREQYHQFMLGRPMKYSMELRNFLMGFGVVSFCLAEFAFTLYKLKPDDQDWVDEERVRAAAAKARIEARIKAQEEKEAK
mmetsp:Transcript_72805/g.204478  ORF Transcript_72805/g.204478 Transcript_72805/m.204478 type:complete len:163 (-) Transcript_72805:99-587(-)|eukprot:CAMPEP_0176216122 /NCGR_PEP_ID=MMETSP0121_2-20121125/17031_1 /TAXON_ID=160619 /ORGANISM="Kryptoperidinium foliaceum, Strain CCMP 1326" /LENGTH=162 /DNA_ID=CAMNT_0017555245 /DNA_START=76 /DNA_END=564 /DNA_ORIENTATION=-